MSDEPKRDKGTGRYAHSQEALCQCGHRLGQHTADRVNGVQPCLEYPCECESFTKAKATRKESRS